MDLIQMTTTRKRNKHNNLNYIEQQHQQQQFSTTTMLTPTTPTATTSLEARETTSSSMGLSRSSDPSRRQQLQLQRQNNSSSFSSRRQQTTGRIKRIILGAIILTLVCVIFNPMAEQRSEAKKIKEKKVLKSLVKGLIFKNLSTKKNFLPLPVPIPVPIELTEPPVYLKGQPKYVTIYKRTPVIKPTPPPPVYHMPIYSPSSYGYMMDPYSLYDNMMLTGSPANYNSYGSALGASSGSHLKQNSGSSYEAPSTTALSSSSSPAASSSGAHSMNFNDFDDEYDNYYAATNRKVAAVAAAASAAKNRRGSPNDYNLIIRRADNINSNNNKASNSGGWLLPTEEQESIDHDDSKLHRRLKRQAYESSYENEPPCYGFPLEVNVKSRIKMHQIFPIHGNSQFKKCIKVGRPLLPPVEDKPPYVHVFTLNKPF